MGKLERSIMPRNYNTKKVSSILGIGGAVWLSIATVGGLAFLFEAYNVLINSREPDWVNGVLYFAGGGLLIWSALTGFSLSVELSLEGLRLRSIWRQKFYTWNELSEIKLVTTHFGTFNIHLKLKDSNKWDALFTAFMSNQRVLAKAAAEAAKLSNPNIALSGWFSSVFSSPPYGIFTEKKADP